MDSNLQISSIVKRKANDLEKGLDHDSALKKRVSFGGNSVMEYSLNQVPQDPSLYQQYISSISLPDQNFIRSLVSKPSSNPSDIFLSTLYRDLRLPVFFDDSQIKKGELNLNTYQKSVSELNSIKQRLIKKCEESEKVAVQKWAAIRDDLNRKKIELKQIKSDMLKEKKKKSMYKVLCESINMSLKMNECNITLNIKDFVFSLQNENNCCKVLQVTGPEKLFTTSKAELKRSEIGTFFFRILDR